MDVKYSFYTSTVGFKLVGGTASQFLKADGSIDSNNYFIKDPFLMGVGDANAIPMNASGIYRFEANSLNVPFPYSPLLHLSGHWGNDTAAQINIHYSSGELQYRGCINGTTYSAWRRAWDNVNLPNPASESWVSTNFIPKSHPVYNVTLAQINLWNNTAHFHSNISFLEQVDQNLRSNQTPSWVGIKTASNSANFLPLSDGSEINLEAEIVNESGVLRLAPAEYRFMSSFLEISDENRLIHIIGDNSKMTLNIANLYERQEYTIYNFDVNNSMTVRLENNIVFSLAPNTSRKLYVTKSLRVIALDAVPCSVIY